MKKINIVDYLRENRNKLTKLQMATDLGFTRDKVRRLMTKHKIVTDELTVDSDIEEMRKQREATSISNKYRELIRRLEATEKERDAVKRLQRPTHTHHIEPSVPCGTGEATAFIIGSDWHIEETVKRDAVNGRNEFNLEVARYRVDTFFSHALKLLKKEQSAIRIKNVVLALLGDFISGNIHDELLESCSLRPIDAILLAKDWITSGIKFLLENSDCHFTIVTSVGNHTRITKQVHIANERGNNLEYFMYHVIAKEFASEPRIHFIIEDSYHTYVKVYDKTIRFHHGHAIKYGGGVGGLTIPVNKAIAQWNKTRVADLDVFGHWHQQFDGGSFLSNGSIIGYNAFALFIKAGFESPKQLFFLMDKTRGKTLVAPILFAK